MESGKRLSLVQKENREKLPEEIDKAGTLFAYGFLMDHDNIRRLLKASRPDEEVAILETTNIDEAARLARQNPDAVIIVRDVEMGGVRVNVATEDQLHRATEKKLSVKIEDYAADVKEKAGHDFLIPARDNQYLMTRVAEEGEVKKTINGGLVIFQERDLTAIDADEYAEGDEGIFARKKAPEISIGGRTFTPRHIEFYAGNVGDLHRFLNPDDPNESRRKAATIYSYDREGRKIGELPKSAKWPHSQAHKIRTRGRGSGKA